jgi:hypothetical protein
LNAYFRPAELLWKQAVFFPQLIADRHQFIGSAATSCPDQPLLPQKKTAEIGGFDF